MSNEQSVGTHLRLDRPRTGLVRLRLDRPDRRNALTVADLADLADAVRSLGADDDRVLVVAGRGPAFCSGFDLDPVAAEPPILVDLIRGLADAATALRGCPLVTIAAVHGHALAGGCALVAACDLAVVAADARLGYPVHRIGVSPAVTLPMLLASLEAGPARAVALGGELLSGADAVALGLASESVERAEDVEARSLALAERVAASGGHALRVTKAWLNELDGSIDPDRRAGPTDASAALGHGDEAAAMLRAFLAARRG